MGRIRTIKPEFNSDEELSSLSCQAHLMAEALLCYADDEGYFNANPGLVRAGTFPLRRDFENISGVLTELSSIGFLRFGAGPDGKRYGQVVHFKTHQRVSHPSPSKIRTLEIVWEDSGNPPEDFARPTETLRPEQGTGNGEQGTGKGNGEAPPALAPEPVPTRPKMPARPALPEPSKAEPPSPVQVGGPDAEEIPEGLATVQYANFILEELRIAAGYALRVKVGDTIAMLALEEACSQPEATRRLLARMHDAQVAGPVKWLFWLEDGNWKAPAAPFSIGIEDEQ